MPDPEDFYKYKLTRYGIVIMVYHDDDTIPYHTIHTLYGLTSYLTHYRSFRRRFNGSDDPTNSIIALKYGG